MDTNIMLALFLGSFTFAGCYEKTMVAEYHEKKKEMSTAKLPIIALQSLQNGDIILREGFGWVSQMIVRLLNEPIPVSHAGMLFWECGEWQVIHSVSGKISEVDGLRIEPLNVFLGNAQPETVLITRLKNCDPKKLKLAAIELLSRDVPFDHLFDLNDTSAFYCSEFIYHTMKQSQCPIWNTLIEDREKLVIGFEQLYDTTHVEIIYKINN